MATISGRVVFDRERSAAITDTDAGLANIPIVLQNIITSDRLTVLTDGSGNYTFFNVPNGEYRIVESYGTPGGIPTPGDFAAALPGSVPQGVNSPITAALNPPAGSTNLDSVTPDTLLVSVSGFDLIGQDFLNGPVIYTPIQAILDPCATVSGFNLIGAADFGTFGSFPQGAAANTGVPTEPYPGVTPDFTYVLPNPNMYAPMGGEYTVQNIMNNAMSTEIGAWWRIADHTTGNETGRMMVVNGFEPGAVFFRSVVNVQPNTNYLFTAWILNLFRVTGFPDSQLGVRVVDQNGDVLYAATLGTLIPVNGNAPEWKQIGTVLNSRNNTGLLVEFLSEGPEVIGNDYAIDDVSFNEILIPEFVPVKTVDSEAVNVGEVVTYMVTFTNTCSSPLNDVLFRDRIPNGFSFVPCSVTVNGNPVTGVDPNTGFALPDVPGGETVTVVFQALAEMVPVPNPVSNSAEIRYTYTPVEGGIPGEFMVRSNEVLVEVVTLADLSVIKTAVPSPAVAGGILTYTVTVFNAGPTSAVNTVLTDSVPPELADTEFSLDGGVTFYPWTGSLALGTLGAGASRIIRIRGTIRASVTGEIVNAALVSSDTPDPNPDNNISTVVTLVVPETTSADLSLIKSSAPNPVQPGGVLTYTLTVFNGGPSPSVDTVLTDQIPDTLSGAEYSINSGATWQPWNGTLNLGTLDAGDMVTVLVRGIVSESASGMIANTGTVASSTPDPDLSNNTDTSITSILTAESADLSVRKVGQPGTAASGETVTYTITTTNQGPDNAENVTLSDVIPPELEQVQFSADGGATWNPWISPYHIGLLPSGQSRTILIRGVVAASAVGTISNTAVVRSDTPDPDLHNNTSTVNISIIGVTGADLSIRKTVTPNPVNRCEAVTNTLIVTNAGPETAEQVVVYDDIANILQCPVYSLDSGQTSQPWTGSLELGSLAPGQSVSVVISGCANACLPERVESAAAAASVTFDPDLSNNRDTAVLRISTGCRPARP